MLYNERTVFYIWNRDHIIFHGRDLNVLAVNGDVVNFETVYYRNVGWKRAGSSSSSRLAVVVTVQV